MPATRLHKRQLDTPLFQDVWDELKTFVIVEKTGRDFMELDHLLMNEHDIATNTDTGRWIEAEITYLLDPSESSFDTGIKPGYCAMSITVLNKGTSGAPGG